MLKKGKVNKEKQQEKNPIHILIIKGKLNRERTCAREGKTANL